MVNNNMLNDSSIGSIGDIGNAGDNASEGRYRLNILDRNSNSGCSKLTVVDLHIIAGTVNSIRSIDEVYSPRRQYNCNQVCFQDLATALGGELSSENSFTSNSVY